MAAVAAPPAEEILNRIKLEVATLTTMTYVMRMMLPDASYHAAPVLRGATLLGSHTSLLRRVSRAGD